ncbi:MAG: polymorphic toxin type 44 domain-containing protein, partial [Rhodoferax sp.]
MTYPTTFGYVGPVPTGVSVSDNVARAQAYQNTHTPAETLQWFYEAFRNNKDDHLPQSDSMDYKQIDQAYADFGNFNYGVVGKALGFPDWVLEYGAGYAQGRADGLTFQQTVIRSVFDLNSKGDNPEDQALIRAGILSARYSGIDESDFGIKELLVQSITSAYNSNPTGNTLRIVAPGLSLSINTLFTSALNWTPPKDP